MQPPTVREVISRIEREGGYLVRKKGGRWIYRLGNRTIVVHGKPSKPLKAGTWGSIKRQAGW